MLEAKGNKPYYGIQLSLNMVGVDIRVNDITIYYDDQRGQLNVDLPAPDSIIDGTNEITIIAVPPILKDESRMEAFMPGADVTASLFVLDIDDPNDKKEILAQLSIVFDDKHLAQIVDTNIGHTQEKAVITLNTETKAVAARKVSLKSPFPQWAWEDGQNIIDNQSNFESLLAAYKEIHDALSRKDIDEVRNLYQERAKEIAIAYHRGSPENGHRMLSTGVDMNDPALELYQFWDKDMKLDVYANGKLARINDADRDQPIVYTDKASGALHLHKFGFYKNESSEWIMVR